MQESSDKGNEAGADNERKKALQFGSYCDSAGADSKVT